MQKIEKSKHQNYNQNRYGKYKWKIDFPESIKKNKYEQRVIDVEKATFCPTVFACNGGAGPSA